MKVSGRRNPVITLDNGIKIQTIGDVHFGRLFLTGVPLEKRGQIELSIRDKFEELLASDAQVVIQVGDIFDKFKVDEAFVKYVAEAFTNAASMNLKKTYVLLRGNHDASKDVTKVSSFDVLAGWLNSLNLSNLIVAEGVEIIPNVGVAIGWSPEKSAEELAEEAWSGENGADIIFGHWDVNLPDHASKFNLLPIETLAKMKPELIVTGHDHKPGKLEREGITIIKTGSIIPLAHGEETEEDELIYTIKPDEYDPTIHDGKIVRFILEEDEDVPEGDFLQVKAIVKQKSETEETESDADSFDLKEILRGFLTKTGVNEDRAAEVVERFSSRNAE